MIWVNEKRTEDRNKTHAGHPNPIARHARTVSPYSYPNLAYIADAKSRNPNPATERRHETAASAIECMSLWWTTCVKNTNPYQKQRAKWTHQRRTSAWLGRRSSLHQHKRCPTWRNKWDSNLIFAQKAHDIRSDPMRPMLGRPTSWRSKQTRSAAICYIKRRTPACSFLLTCAFIEEWAFSPPLPRIWATAFRKSYAA